MAILLIAIYAAIAMVIQDILSTLLTQAESRNKAHLAGWLDSFAWIAAISTTTLSVSTLEGHDFGKKVAVVVLVSAANYVGTVAGTRIGQRFIPEEAKVSVGELALRVKSLEQHGGEHNG